MNPTETNQIYNIRVRGQIPACWSESFADLYHEIEMDACGPVTRLRGVFTDSAALHGVLNNLFMLGLSLISLVAYNECQDRDQQEEFEF